MHPVTRARYCCRGRRYSASKIRSRIRIANTLPASIPSKRGINKRCWSSSSQPKKSAEGIGSRAPLDRIAWSESQSLTEQSLAPLLRKHCEGDTKMVRYQVRTPNPIRLEDVVEELTRDAFHVLMAWHVFNCDQPPASAFQQFEGALHQSLDRCVKTYKLCGLSNICLDEVKSTPWSFESHVMDAQPTDFVYHLYPGANPRKFLENLANESLHSIETLIGTESKDEALSCIYAVFREGLGKFVYHNPVCGKTELCALSSSAPIKVWGHK
jgi:hypothetical protein